MSLRVLRLALRGSLYMGGWIIVWFLGGFLFEQGREG